MSTSQSFSQYASVASRGLVTYANGTLAYSTGILVCTRLGKEASSREDPSLLRHAGARSSREEPSLRREAVRLHAYQLSGK